MSDTSDQLWKIILINERGIICLSATLIYQFYVYSNSLQIWSKHLHTVLLIQVFSLLMVEDVLDDKGCTASFSLKFEISILFRFLPSYFRCSPFLSSNHLFGWQMKWTASTNSNSPNNLKCVGTGLLKSRADKM